LFSIYSTIPVFYQLAISKLLHVNRFRTGRIPLLRTKSLPHCDNALQSGRFNKLFLVSEKLKYNGGNNNAINTFYSRQTAYAAKSYRSDGSN